MSQSELKERIALADNTIEQLRIRVFHEQAAREYLQMECDDLRQTVLQLRAELQEASR